MHVLYVIQSRNDLSFYIGITPDLRRRLENHNKGRVISTKSKVPWEMIYCEIYRSKEDAVKREQKLKQHKNSWYRLRERIKNSILERE